MTVDRRALDRLSRDQLIERAREQAVPKAELLTRAELVDEILRRTVTDDQSRRRLRGWLGVARDLLASAVERRLDLPETAKLIRGDGPSTEPPPAPAPVATVTLAEIFAAQGHVGRAMVMLDDVLTEEPDHAAARRLRDRLVAADGSSPGSEPPPSNGVLPSEPAAAPAVDEPAGRDVVVVVRLDPVSTYVYWEIAPPSLARARARWPDGRAEVRVISLQPSWDGAARAVRTVVAAALQGGETVEGFGDRAEVRAALGWRSGREFHALAVATEIRTAPAPGGTASVVWRPRASVGVGLEPHHLRALAHLQGARTDRRGQGRPVAAST